MSLLVTVLASDLTEVLLASILALILLSILAGFFFFLPVALEPVAGVPSELAPAFFLSRSLRCQFFFFSIRAFSADCSDYGLPADFCCGGAAFVFSEDCLLESLSVSFSDRFSLGQRWSKCWLLWMRALALALFAALTSLSQGSCCRPTSSIHNFIEGLSPSQNVRRVGLLRGHSQHQTPIELTGSAPGGRPSPGLFLVGAGSRFSFWSRRCQQTHRIPLGFVLKRP